MYEVVKNMGIVIVIAVYCLCSMFVVKCMRDITRATIEKIGYLAALAEKEEKDESIELTYV